MCQPPTAAQVSAPPPTTTTGEKTGRWTDEEHTRFLHGLELFGKKWTKVADVVGSRTTVQVRSHAQKYFQKLEKDRAQPSGSGGRGRAGAGFGGRQFGDYDGLDEGAAPIAVPLALRKFLPAGTGQNGHAGPADVAAGLFKFLSPLALPSKPDKVNEMARTIFDDPAADLHHQQLEARSRPAPPPTVPEWYRRGGRLDELLRDAAQIEWKDDSGGEPLKDPPPPVYRAPPPPKPFPRRPSAQWALPPGKRRRDEEALAHIATGTERGAAALPRFSSLDALYSASILVDRRPRSDSHGSTGLGFEDGLFYDDDGAPFGFTDDQAPTI
jgi:SHAQKYF class myb-like DNA-binding protein